jgi:hypothetical protein
MLLVLFLSSMPVKNSGCAVFTICLLACGHLTSTLNAFFMWLYMSQRTGISLL